MLMALVSLIGLFIGIYLTMYKLGFIGTLACGVSSCEKVQSSRWSYFLGVPVATWGGAFYGLMLALTLASLTERFGASLRLSQTILAVTGIGVLFTAYLNYLEAFVLHAWCMWCIISACLVIVLFLLAWLDWRETREVVESPIGE